jgi:NTP pyrophosphatase (non-canonical NTP hydrolase)
MLMDSFVLIATDIHAFAQRRNWIDKYSEQSLAMSLIAETGELAEVFQWSEPSQFVSDVDLKSLNNCAMEIADIYVYLFHLCRVIGLNKSTLESLSKH